MDQSTGTSYQKGYYDENGQHYENVAFEKNGRYENVLCHCPYCDRDTILNLDAKDAGMLNLECPHCGGTMELRSQLDDILSQPTENTHSYNSAESLENAFPKKKKKKKVWPWIVGILVAFGLYGNFMDAKEEASYNYVEPLTITEHASVPNDVQFGDTVYLNSVGGNEYTFAPSGTTSGDKVLEWMPIYDSYYDEKSDCYLGYNDDAGVWQYWYEGISSNFGDYGWMEHYDDGWFIEKSDGNWVELPAEYDVSGLWYIG